MITSSRLRWAFPTASTVVLAGLLFAGAPASAQPVPPPSVAATAAAPAAETGAPVTMAITPTSGLAIGKLSTLKLVFGTKVTGTLEWKVDGQHVPWNWFTGVDIGTITDSSTSSLWNHVFLTPGEHTVEAFFTGAAGYLDATTSLTVTAADAPAAATTTKVNAPATAVAGTPFEVKAAISPTATNGTVQFKDGENNLGAPVPVMSGKASLQATFAVGGSHSLTAIYSGGAAYTESTSAPVVVEAANVATTVTLTAPATAKVGVDVALKVAVTPAEAGGTVQFKDSETKLGDAVAVGADGVATLTQAFTTEGDHSISAVYTPTAGYDGVTAAAVAVKVAAAEQPGGGTGSSGSADSGSADLGSLSSIFGSRI